ncbi:hypothetical protein [Anaerosporobacter sp.]
MGRVMKFLRNKKRDKSNWLEGKETLEPKFAETIEVSTKDNVQKAEEYEIVERVIYPEKIICPDCGGITLEGLDFCDKCGGELHDISN